MSFLSNLEARSHPPPQKPSLRHRQETGTSGEASEAIRPQTNPQAGSTCCLRTGTHLSIHFPEILSLAMAEIDLFRAWKYKNWVDSRAEQMANEHFKICSFSLCSGFVCMVVQTVNANAPSCAVDWEALRSVRLNSCEIFVPWIHSVSCSRVL